MPADSDTHAIVGFDGKIALLWAEDLCHGYLHLDVQDWVFNATDVDEIAAKDEYSQPAVDWMVVWSKSEVGPAPYVDGTVYCLLYTSYCPKIRTAVDHLINNRCGCNNEHAAAAKPADPTKHAVPIDAAPAASIS